MRLHFHNHSLGLPYPVFSVSLLHCILLCSLPFCLQPLLILLVFLLKTNTPTALEQEWRWMGGAVASLQWRKHSPAGGALALPATSVDAAAPPHSSTSSWMRRGWGTAPGAGHVKSLLMQRQNTHNVILCTNTLWSINLHLIWPILSLLCERKQATVL